MNSQYEAFYENQTQRGLRQSSHRRTRQWPGLTVGISAGSILHVEICHSRSDNSISATVSKHFSELLGGQGIFMPLQNHPKEENSLVGHQWG